MELVRVGIKEFKEIIYPNYVKMFPKLERKNYLDFEKSYNNEITTFFNIMVDSTFVGFAIMNTVKGLKYVQLDYLAILPQYQSKGYGTETLKKLKTIYADYYGIFIEVEKLGLGDTEEENIIRQRRENFYKNMGFLRLNFDLNLYTVMFSVYILDCSSNIENEEQIIYEIFTIYESIIGKKRVKDNCSVIRKK